MLKRLFLMLLLIGITFLYFTYHATEYVVDDVILNNGIHTKGIMSNNEIYLLEQIDTSVLSGYIQSGGLVLSSNSGVPLEDDVWGYSFIMNNNRNYFLFVRSSVYHTWRVDNPFTMTCEGPGCPMPWRLNIFDSITIDVQPKRITDIVIEQSGQQTILQGMGGSRTTQVKRGP